MVDFKKYKHIKYQHNYPRIFKAVARGDMPVRCTDHQGVKDIKHCPNCLHLGEIAAFRSLILTDLFFIIYFVMEVPIANKKFVVDACRDVEDGPPTKTVDIWARGHFKNLSADTPVPTPCGWSTHGELRAGSKVYSPSGDVVDVVATEHFAEDTCYDVNFDDGSTIIAGAGHLWKVEAPSRKRIDNSNRRIGRETQIIPTKDLKSLMGAAKYRVGIALPSALKGEDVDLPIDPYLLGAWLGDGFSASGRVCGMDDEVFNEIERCGSALRYGSTGTNTNEAYRVALVEGLHVALRESSLLGAKSIPSEYLRASYAQRLALLQGLMDTDGTCEPRGTATFCNTNEKIVDGLVELLHTFGIKVNKRKHVLRLNGEPYEFFQVSFQGYKDTPPFKIKRKLARCRERSTQHNQSKTRYIDSITPCDSTPTNCIQVSSEDGMYLAGKSMTPTHNSTIITVAETVQYAVKYPNRCTCIFSYKKPAAEDFLDAVRKTLEMPIMTQCFPDVLYAKPDTEAPSWSLQNGITIKRSGKARKEATVEASGLVEGMCTGKHFERRIYDDVETADTADKVEQMEKCFSRFEMSKNLGMPNDKDIGLFTVERIIGTYYSHCGALVQIRDKKDVHERLIYHTRLKPATHNGEIDGDPVFMSHDELDALKTDMHFNSQQLCDPTPLSARALHSEYLQDIDTQFIPKNTFDFMLIDPAGDDTTGDGDCWAIMVVGVDPHTDKIGASNVYIKDMIISPLSESEAPDEIVRMYLRAGIIEQVGVEKVALSTTEMHVSAALAKRGKRVTVDNKRLVLLKPAGRNKVRRIEAALAWPLDNGKLFMSKDIPSMYRQKLRMEMDGFPFAHPDGLDALAYLYDMLPGYRFAARPDESEEGNKMESDYDPFAESHA